MPAMADLDCVVIAPGCASWVTREVGSSAA
jgi:hypothetical protein